MPMTCDTTTQQKRAREQSSPRRGNNLFHRRRHWWQQPLFRLRLLDRQASPRVGAVSPSRSRITYFYTFLASRPNDGLPSSRSPLFSSSLSALPSFVPSSPFCRHFLRPTYFHTHPVPSLSVLARTVPFHTVSIRSVPYHLVPYRSYRPIPHCLNPFHTISCLTGRSLYRTILFRTVLKPFSSPPSTAQTKHHSQRPLPDESSRSPAVPGHRSLSTRPIFKLLFTHC